MAALLENDTALLLVLAGTVVAALVTAVAAWLVIVRLRAIEDRLGRLDRLDDLQRGVARFLEERGELDLKRVEHALYDIRDGQKRVEDRMLAVIESRASAGGGSALLGAPTGGALAERVVTRLLALGYERVQLVSSTDELAVVAESGGEVLVEARRDGAPCKGRVRVKQGAIVDVAIQSAYSAFP
ncbi:MAG: hypothetical protein ACKVWV_18540 [Planctomycetota bacterium]